MDWKNCIDEGNSVKVAPNSQRARFLVRNAERTLKAVSAIKITDENIIVFFTNYYDALLETLHAVMYAKGYKVKNHYCLGYYVRDVMKDDGSFRAFDRSRSVRNSIIYYGDSFDRRVLDDLIKQIVDLCEKLKKVVEIEAARTQIKEGKFKGHESVKKEFGVK